MNVKTYRAKTMQEALALVREELGAKASVLRTRELRPRGLSRFWSGSAEVEVTASANVSVPSRLPNRQAVVAPVPVPAIHAGLDLTAAPANIRVGRVPVEPTAGMSARLARVFGDLLAADIEETNARRLIECVRNIHGDCSKTEITAIRQTLAAAIESQIDVTGPIQASRGRQRVVAFVGPTGVGKTTTIAKLAAHFQINEKRRVGLVTVDTYRIGAAEQLRTYANIIELPLEVATTPGEVKQAIARMAGVDLVLVDTAGRSPHDEEKVLELRSLLAGADADEVHLVLSGVAATNCLSKSVECFRSAGTTALILTKLDEMLAFGGIYNLLCNCKIPLSYLTHGQDVPADILVAERSILARSIVGLASVNQDEPVSSLV